MALSLGAEGVTHLEDGQWEASVNYRYLGRIGLNFEIWPNQGLSLSFGGHGSGAFADYLVIASYTRRF